MIQPYIDALTRALGSALELIVKLSVPLAIGLGLVFVAGALFMAHDPDSGGRRRNWRRYAGSALGYAGVAALVLVGWAVLSAILPVERESIDWRESAEATGNPTPDAPAINQFGPAAAALVERTYTRTLTLPPDFLQRIGADGIGVLAPYLSNPSAEDVLRLVDTFRRSGKDVVFTRQVTQLAEDPIPFSASNVRVRFRRLPGRAYDADFEGRYTFGNAIAQPITARFQFPLPVGITIRDLNVTVGGQSVAEPNDAGAYEWKSQLGPGERREAIVRYRALGARTWTYDLGSARRRVQQFRLDADPGGRVSFLRASLQPTSSSRGSLRWDLSNVITAQRAAIAFPPDTTATDCYLQALSALPASLMLFLVGIVAVGLRVKQRPTAPLLAIAVLLFAFGLGAAPILASYLGPLPALILAPLAGALLAALAMSTRSVTVGVPAALLPATFLSAEHTGPLVLLLAVLALAGAAALNRVPARTS